LMAAAEVRIIRYVKIRSDVNPKTLFQNPRL
jgi:hypothetical protein